MAKRIIGFLGAGQMARALAGGFARADLVSGSDIVAFDPSSAAEERFAAEVAGARLLRSNTEVVETAAVVILAVKPQQIESVAAEINGQLRPEQLLVSIAAGIALERLASAFRTERIVRVMPNTPCLVGVGAAGYSLGKATTDEDAQLVGQLMNSVGLAFQVEERLLDAVTGLSGSGPAFAYMIVEALADGGVRMGLPRDTAIALAAQTLLGSARMVLASGQHPAVLKDRVASPGGTTIAGIQALEQHGLRAALMAAVQSATNRSRELGEE